MKKEQLVAISAGIIAVFAVSYAVTMDQAYKARILNLIDRSVALESEVNLGHREQEQIPYATSHSVYPQVVSEYPLARSLVTGYSREFLGFRHECVGEVVRYLAGSFPASAYCLGENKLVAVTTEGEKIISTSRVDKVEDAPQFFRFEELPATKQSATKFLVSYYVPGVCFTEDDCGPGGNYDRPTHLVDLGPFEAGDQMSASSLTVVELTHFPQEEATAIVWNPSRTRALVLPQSCDEAGCGLVSPMVYDVLTDATSAVTAEQARGSECGVKGEWNAPSYDVNPKDLPCWDPSSIGWTDDTHVSMSILTSDGKSRVVKWSF